MFPELSSSHYLLKQILPEDQQFIFDGLSHPKVIPYYGVRYHSFEDAKRQLDFYEDLWHWGTGIWWKIVDKKTLEKTGAIGFNNYQVQHNKAEIGYWLLPQFWKRGIITEVLPVLIDYIQNQKNIHRIEALVEEDNHASRKVLERFGFTYEGKMRDCEYKDDRYISLLIYSLLETDKLNS